MKHDETYSDVPQNAIGCSIIMLIDYMHAAYKKPLRFTSITIPIGNCDCYVHCNEQ